MSHNTTVTLDDHFTNFIDQQIDGGRYDNATAVMQAALSLLEEQEAKFDAIRAALIEGEESGISSRSVLDILEAMKKRNAPNR